MLRNHDGIDYEAKQVSRDLVYYAEDLKQSLLKDFKRRGVTMSIVIISVGIDRAPRWG